MLRIAESISMAFRPMRALLLLVALAIWAERCFRGGSLRRHAVPSRLTGREHARQLRRVHARPTTAWCSRCPSAVPWPNLACRWCGFKPHPWIGRAPTSSRSRRAIELTRKPGGDDYAALNDEVARVLSQIALSTRSGIAHSSWLCWPARQLAEWPRQHHGYRQDDVARDRALIDEAITNLRAAGGATNFDLTLVAIGAVDVAGAARAAG